MKYVVIGYILIDKRLWCLGSNGRITPNHMEITMFKSKRDARKVFRHYYNPSPTWKVDTENEYMILMTIES
jgi:hypothetical protein